MRIRNLPALLLIASVVLAVEVHAHEGVVVGHSPPDAGASPPCPTLDPLRLFVLPDVRVGGPIAVGESEPFSSGEVTSLLRLTTNALLARPEFGGFVYVADAPGLDYVDSGNPCHAMTTAHTGGVPFEVGMQRVHWPSDAQLAMTDPFGVLVLPEDGDEWYYANQAAGHLHPLWLMRRAGTYHMSQRFVSDYFSASDEFSLSFTSTPECGRPVRFDLSGVFNTDVVDSDDGDTPTPFDGTFMWVVNGAYGTTMGLPSDGRLDVFELGGPNGSSLMGAAENCLIDDGLRTVQSSIDLIATQQSGNFESIEMLLAGSGTFGSSDTLVTRVVYDSGNDQVVSIRRAAVNPLYFPLRDWQITVAPLPILSVGRDGSRSGGGFVRSNGNSIDAGAGDAFYFQRVTFPVDPSRELVSIDFDDYTGGGSIGVFAISGIAERLCPTGDFDEDGSLNSADLPELPDCTSGPAQVITDASCYAGDFDFDDDVDLKDFGAFQRLFGAAP